MKVGGRAVLSSEPEPAKRTRRRRGLLGWLLLLPFILIGICLGLILLYRLVQPPITPLMLLRLGEGEGIDHRPVPLSQIALPLQKAVIASEDNRFCQHHGIDWQAVNSAIDEHEEGGRLRGASTITMQTARNLFLWPGGGYPRKAVEGGLALTLDALWPKRRIMAVYLNAIEWGNGVYGAEAAAELYFKTSAARLTRGQAALMAAVLPNPRRWSPARPTGYIEERARSIETRMDQLEGSYYDCLR
jgi:monofunctional biosynthetic peptidoglycan transglycosylase